MQMDLMALWHGMGWFAKGWVYTLFIMSAYSFTVIF